MIFPLTLSSSRLDKSYVYQDIFYFGIPSNYGALYVVSVFSARTTPNYKQLLYDSSFMVKNPANDVD